ncbi:MAG TPA: hypothetical protein VGL06_15335, partial [Pseudonocardiaceae bacterium]
MADDAKPDDALVAAVQRGEMLDLSGTDPIAKSARDAWSTDHDIDPERIRDVLLNATTSKPDPRGLRLKGARITDRLDLENITTTVALELESCLLVGGINARGAQLRDLSLVDCVIVAAAGPAVDAQRLSANVVQLASTDVTAHAERGAIVLDGARLDTLVCQGMHVTNAHGPALTAANAAINHDVVLADVDATGFGEPGTVRLAGAHINGQLDLCRAHLTNASGPALHAEGMQVGQGTFLRDGFTASGAG